MLTLWYISDGNVEEYKDQQVSWKNSVIVLAARPEEALIKLMHYHQGRLARVEMLHNSRQIYAIV